MKQFKFTQEDLNANRDGYMSERQKLHWRQRRRLTTLAFRLGQILVVILLAGLVQLTVQKNGITWLAFIVGLMGLAVLWTTGDLLNPAMDYHDDLRKGHVYTICGIVERLTLKKAYRSRPSEVYKIRLENVEFRVNPDQWAVFTSRREYCVYYMPESKIVLSVEPLH